jgi:hypothetical protein
MDKCNHIYIYWLFLLMLGNASSLSAIEPAEVVVSPDGTSQYGGYLIKTRLEDPQPWIQVEANIDSIILFFNPETTLPSLIDPSLVTVNHVACSALKISGFRLAILSPVDLRNFLAGSADLRLEIPANARIKNPLRAGEYRIRIQLVQSNGELITKAIPSLSYQIKKSSSLSTAATVSPNPPLTGRAAALQIRFETGSAGFLKAGSSRIIIQFDKKFKIPKGQIAGVSVNGTTAVATGSDKTVVITTPVEADNCAEVIVQFSTGSGIITPAESVTTQVQVKTSSENRWVTSFPFFIGPPDSLTVAFIRAVPAVANARAGYEVEILRAKQPDRIPAQDTLALIFENNTRLPAEISARHVHVLAGGFNTAVSNVLIKDNNQENPDTLQVILPQEISRLSALSLTIDQSAGILNPSESGQYRLTVQSSRSAQMAGSNPYFIKTAETAVSQAKLNASTFKTAEAAAYHMGFNLGEHGRLQPGKSKIYLTFEEDYNLPSANSLFDSTFISFADRPFCRIESAGIVLDNQKKHIELPVPHGAENENGDPVRLYLTGVQGPPLKNPDRPGNHTLLISTSVEPLSMRSLPYAIGGQMITVDYLTLSDTSVNSISGFSLGFQTESALKSSDGDYIELTFPAGTILPPTIASSKILINHEEAAALQIYPATQTIKAAIPQFAIAAGDTITIEILPESKIINPAIPAKKVYNLRINTSKDIIPVASRSYDLVGKDKAVSIIKSEIEPAVTDVANVDHQIDFLTTDSGELHGGRSGMASSVTVRFDSATIVPNYIPAQSVTINENQAGGVEVLRSGPGGTVRVILPPGMVIKSRAVAALRFEAGAALATSAKPGSCQIRVRTSSDTLFSTDGGRFDLKDTKSLSVNSVIVNPSDQNNMAAYAIRFMTGARGGLRPGDLIRLVFSAHTFLPASISEHDITVNGKNPPARPVVSSDTLVVPVPFLIDRMTAVSLLINREAGILNSSVSGSYTIGISTTAEPEKHLSPAFQISTTRSTVSAVAVESEPATIGMQAVYKISFNTGVQGRLPAGEGGVTLTFDPGTVLSQDPDDYDSSYIMVDGRSTRLSPDQISLGSHKLAVSVPENVSIDNQDRILIILGGTKTAGPIRNPAIEGSYTLQVRTSVELTPISSSAYKISAVPPVSPINVSLSQPVVNAESAVSVLFYIQRAVPPDGGTITVSFPPNTLIPPEINSRTISLAHDPHKTGDLRPVAQVSTNPAIGTVTLTVREVIPKNEWVQVVFSQEAGLENPSFPGNYRLKVRTSSQETDGHSMPYALAPGNTAGVNLSVEIFPDAPGHIGRSVWSFTTGALGRLVPGMSEIGLLIPADSRFINGLPALSKVTVNGLPAHSLKLKTRAGMAPDTLIITVPPNVTIGNTTDVSVVIDSTAGLKNTTSTVPKIYSAFTSAEPKPVDTRLSLPAQIASFTSESKSGIVFLQWISESQLEDAYWMIERKLLSAIEFQSIQDGRRTLDESGPPFEALAYIQGQFLFSSKAMYTYADSLVDIGAIYAYRLSDVDYDGKINYHDVVYQEVNPPSDFILYKNSPNPFKTHTSISYSLPAEAQVNLKIYNVEGREVMTLVEASQAAGFYRLDWSGTNENGQSVASGLYIVSFKASAVKSGKEYAKILKIMLIR